MPDVLLFHLFTSFTVVTAPAETAKETFAIIANKVSETQTTFEQGKK
jgi:hypothetical protein